MNSNLNMKHSFSFIIVAAFALFALSEANKELLEYFKPVIDGCAKKLNSSPEEKMHVIHFELTDDSDGVKCLHNCIMEDVNHIKDGQLKVDAIKADFTEAIGAEKTEHIIQKCVIPPAGGDKCDTAYQFVKCFKNLDHV